MDSSKVLFYNTTTEQTAGKKGTVGFDLDDTIIAHGSGQLLPYAREKIIDLYKSGSNIVIITNQSTKSIGNEKLQTKLETVSDSINIPLLIICSRKDDEYRKPNIKSLTLIPPYLGKIHTYVGDAAGRPGDHSDCDKLFAENAKLKFVTPEEYFYSMFETLSRTVIHPYMTIDEVEILTVVILIGCPASGKSTYAHTVLKDYQHISRDVLVTMAHCLKDADIQLAQKNSVVIDNLNKDEASRQPFISLGQKYRCRIIGVHFLAPISHGMHYNKTRA